MRGSAKLAHTQKMHTITPRHVMLAKAANPELDRLIGPCIIADSGAVPYLPVPFRSKGEQQRLKKKSQLLLDGPSAPLALQAPPAEKKTQEERAELKAQKSAARQAAREAQEKAAEEAKGLKKAAAKIAAAKEKRALTAAAAEKPAKTSKSKAKETEKPAAKAKKASASKQK